jgi:hypothetical protein
LSGSLALASKIDYSSRFFESKVSAKDVCHHDVTSL